MGARAVLVQAFWGQTPGWDSLREDEVGHEQGGTHSGAGAGDVREGGGCRSFQLSPRPPKLSQNNRQERRAVTLCWEQELVCKQHAGYDRLKEAARPPCPRLAGGFHSGKGKL